MTTATAAPADEASPPGRGAVHPTASEPAAPAPAAHPHDLLRFATAGSVDDGKSTLVGRLLHDTRSVLADQFDAVERASRDRGLEAADLALLTDGLRAEREQGITIDVAYRYFSTPTRSFILADTPGHVEYTRNMVTGASTAELALVLVDARHGVVEQTRRHLAVAALLGVRHVALTVNKMDLVGWDRDVFDAISEEFRARAATLGIEDVVAIPLSALHGDNVVDRSRHTPWFTGPTLLEHLEAVPVGTDPRTEPARLPVQLVVRPRTAAHHDYRGYAGRLASGTLRVGDEIVVSPTGRSSTIVGIDVPAIGGGVVAVAEAFAPQSVTVRLADDVDVARGDVLARGEPAPHAVRELVGAVAVVADRPIRARDRLLVRAGTRVVRALVEEIVDELDVGTLDHRPASAALSLNAIGRVRLRLAEPVALDDYRALRHTGSFLLVDEADGATLAAGMARLGREDGCPPA